MLTKNIPWFSPKKKKIWGKYPSIWWHYSGQPRQEFQQQS